MEPAPSVWITGRSVRPTERRRFARRICVALVAAASIAQAGTNFSYDTSLFPRSLPPSPPWSIRGGSGGDRQIATDKLTLVDTNDNTAGYYYVHPFGSNEISATSEYQARSRARLIHYGDLGQEKPLYSVVLNDGSHLVGFGMTRDANKHTRFFFLDGAGSPAGSVHSEEGERFFDVVLTKSGTTGGSADNVTLHVDGMPVLTKNYGNFPTSTTRDVYFGTSAGGAFGTVELVGASFGIDQAAPLVGSALRRSHAPTLPRSVRFPFRNGDRVVFLGDSITEQRLYTTYIESYLLTRFPSFRFTFRNAGHSGDTAWLRKRGSGITDEMLFAAQSEEQEELIATMVRHGLRRDVLPLKPTVVVINLGFNDAKASERFPAYRRAMQELVTQLKKANIRIVLLTTSPKEGTDPGSIAGLGYNRTLDVFAEAVRALAAKETLPFADQLHPYLEVVDRARRVDPAFKTMPDGSHPAPAGHLIMAWAVLKGLGAPRRVSQVGIHVREDQVWANTTNARVRQLTQTNCVIAFTCLDAALPMPLPREASEILPHAPILGELSRHILLATGLTAGSYEVWMDGQKVTTLSRSQLESGWNMTAANTPMAAQAEALMAKVFEKNDAYFQRWREMQLPAIQAKRADDADVRAKLQQADQRIAALEAEIGVLRKPRLHRFELRPSPQERTN